MEVECRDEFVGLDHYLTSTATSTHRTLKVS